MVAYVVALVMLDATFITARGPDFPQPPISVLVGAPLLGGLVAAALIPIVHECGHVVFGLASGYRFSMASCYRWAVVATDEGMRLRRFRSAPFAGQCLMAPPDLHQGRMPYLAYCLGGIAFNALACIVASAVFVSAGTMPSLSLACLAFSAMNLHAVAVNALPHQNGFGYSDGANISVLRENLEALEALWVQLKVADAQVRGTRMAEMPRSWLAKASEISPEDRIRSPLLLYPYIERLDVLDIEGALELMEGIVASSGKLPPLSRCMLRSDYQYCAAVLGSSGSRRSNRLPGDGSRIVEDGLFEAFKVAMSRDPSVLRSECASILFDEGDPEGATRILHRFQRECARFPISSVAASENELMRETWVRYEKALEEKSRNSG